MQYKVLKLFLRLAVGIAFLSASADRLGFLNNILPADSIAWGNWENFVSYTALLNPWCPEGFLPILAVIATTAEILFGLCLIIGLSTEFFAKWSGVLLLIFAFSMAFTLGIKAPLDYSVFAAAGASFALSTMKEKVWELDLLFKV